MFATTLNRLWLRWTAILRAFFQGPVVTHPNAVDRQGPRLTSDEANLSDCVKVDHEMLADRQHGRRRATRT